MDNRTVLILSNLNFLISGVLQNLLAFQLDLVGLGSKSVNNLLAAAQPLGGTFLCLLLDDNFLQLRALGVKPWIQRHWKLAFLDMIGSICTQASIALIGSGIFTVVYSSVVVYIAILNKLKFHRDVSKLRWIALLLITAFVVVSALGQLSGGTNFFSTALGIIFALGATVSYGTLYVVLSDIFERDRAQALANSTPVMSKTFLLLCVCSLELCFCLLYFLAAVVPNWEAWIAQPMRQRNTTVLYGLGMYALIVFCDGTHMIG